MVMLLKEYFSGLLKHFFIVDGGKNYSRTISEKNSSRIALGFLEVKNTEDVNY